MFKSLMASTAVMALLCLPAAAHGTKTPPAPEQVGHGQVGHGQVGHGTQNQTGHAAHAAHAAPAEPVAVTGDPQVDIPVKLKSIFESEGKPLAVAPVVVAGGWAIAGWTQDGRGGRALLKQKADGWSIHLCSGDSLKDATVLQQIGIAEHDARTLAANLASAEASIAPETLALFASFEGTVMVEGEAHGHGGGHAGGHSGGHSGGHGGTQGAGHGTAPAAAKP
ncbi:copper uptake system-associated protein [Pannonibacter tanglangensis]|nr:copper uptake system-associated protein [Pannonibacter sp. XCT-34]